MKLRVSVALLNGHGSSAYIGDEQGDTFVIAEGLSLLAKQACKKAAKELRDAAARFDSIAKEACPYNAIMQNKINKMAVPK